MSGLVGNPEDWFSHDAAHFVMIMHLKVNIRQNRRKLLGMNIRTIFYGCAAQFAQNLVGKFSKYKCHCPSVDRLLTLPSAAEVVDNI